MITSYNGFPAGRRKYVNRLQTPLYSRKIEPPINRVCEITGFKSNDPSLFTLHNEDYGKPFKSHILCNEADVLLHNRFKNLYARHSYLYYHRDKNQPTFGFKTIQQAKNWVSDINRPLENFEKEDTKAVNKRITEIRQDEKRRKRYHNLSNTRVDRQLLSQEEKELYDLPSTDFENVLVKL